MSCSPSESYSLNTSNKCNRRAATATETAPWIVVAGGVHRHGGTDRANYALVDYLLKNEIPVHVVANNVDSELTRRKGMQAHIVPRPARSWLLGEQLLWLKAYRIARKLTRQNPSTRVVVNGGNCPWADVNWVHYVHHAARRPLKQGPWLHRLKHKLAESIGSVKEAASLKIARVIVTNSDITRQQIIANLGVSPAKVFAIRLGAESDWAPPTEPERLRCRALFQQTSGRPLIAFVGAIGYDQNKGLDTVWRAWNILCQNANWDGDLIVAGDGPALPGWRRLVAASTLQNRVRFLGFTKEIPELLAAADLLVSPARYESFGLNVQEAICRGIPAIVTAHAGVAELYPSEFRDLLLPDPDNFQDLAARIAQWRVSIEHWRAVVPTLSAALRKYSWENMACRFYSLVTANNP